MKAADPKYCTGRITAIKKGVIIIPATKKYVLQEIQMTFYESIANQVRRPAVRILIETSGECAMHFDQEVKCVTDTGQLFHRFAEEGALLSV